MGQAITRLVSSDADQTRSSRRKKSASNRRLSSKEASRGKSSKTKVKAARSRTVATKPRPPSRPKPRKRRTNGQSASSQHNSHPRGHSKSKRASTSIGGLYSDHVSSRPAPRLKRKDPDILVSDKYRNRLPEKTQNKKKSLESKPSSPSKPSKKSTASRKAPSSHRNSQKLPRSTVYDDIEEYPPHGGSVRTDCIVCAESKTARHFPTRPPTAACTHEVQTCTRCLRQWIQSEFEGKVWDQIDCPECRERLQYEDVRQFAPSAIFRKYERLSTKAALEAIPGFRWCPGKGCTSGQVHGSGYESPKFQCIACNRRFCVVHNRRWHEGETCAEFDYRTDGTQKRIEEKASEKLIKETAKKCPGCNGNVQKISGCDHMTCSKCRHQFCWICLAPYGPIRNEGNNKHRKTCIYYSA